MVNINDLAPGGTSIGAFFGNLLGGVGSFLGGLAGGVAANKRLRARLKETLPNVYYAPAELCTDNGAMIAYAGYVRLAAGEREPLHIDTRARWPITDLGPVGGDAS